MRTIECMKSEKQRTMKMKKKKQIKDDELLVNLTEGDEKYNLFHRLKFWASNIVRKQHQCRSFCVCCKYYGECSYDFK